MFIPFRVAGGKKGRRGDKRCAALSIKLSGLFYFD